MTTIAFKDNVLASDTQVTWGTQKHIAKKIYYLPESKIWIGIAGDTNVERQALEIFSDPNWKSLELSTKAKNFSAIILIDKQLHFCTGNFLPIPLMDRFFAVGTGAPYAVAAMSLGSSAVGAIKVASEFDIFTNNNIVSHDISIENV